MIQSGALNHNPEAYLRFLRTLEYSQSSSYITDRERSNEIENQKPVSLRALTIYVSEEDIL